MKEVKCNATFSLYADYKFYVIPTIELDWHSDKGYGYTNFKWLWFGLSILSTSITVPPTDIPKR